MTADTDILSAHDFSHNCSSVVGCVKCFLEQWQAKIWSAETKCKHSCVHTHYVKQYFCYFSVLSCILWGKIMPIDCFLCNFCVCDFIFLYQNLNFWWYFEVGCEHERSWGNWLDWLVCCPRYGYRFVPITCRICKSFIQLNLLWYHWEFSVHLHCCG